MVGGLSRTYAGENLAEILNIKTYRIPPFDTIENANEDIDFDILIDFTSPFIAKKNILNAIDKGEHALAKMGSSKEVKRGLDTIMDL